MKEAKSLDGIISHLSQKHGGNVHEKGIVTITSKSVHKDDPKYVADLTSDSRFKSKYYYDPGQWICRDFGEMCVRPTHYTIMTEYLKSWVVEGSLDGRSWTEIDRPTFPGYRHGGCDRWRSTDDAVWILRSISEITAIQLKLRLPITCHR
jgi:hypothetical protein